MKKDGTRIYTEDELKILHDVYSLWWEYLCQSFWYREFCEEIHKAKFKSVKIPDNLFDRIINKLSSISDSLRKKSRINSYCPSKFILKSYWEFFGNIHYDKFERWWENKKDSLVKRKVFDLRDPDTFEFFDFQSITRPKKFAPQRFPKPVQILRSITSDQEYIFVAIPLRDLTLVDIGKQITQIRKKQMNKCPNKPKWLSEVNISLEGKKGVDEQKRYLEYFKLKTNRTLSEDEIIEKRNKEELERNKHSLKTRDELQRIIHGDVKRAEKIIKNVEKGIFPGKYQPQNK